MPDEQVLQRIEAWAAQGLIDESTADRLREAEAAEPGEPGREHARGGPGGVAVRFSSVFGPNPSMAEILAYLGGGFLLAAWHTLISTWLGPVVDFSGGVPKADWLRGGIEWLVPVLVLTLAAVALAGRRDRERRAAAVAFAVATGHVWALTQQVGFTLVDYQSHALIGGAVSVGVAFVYRARLASLVTHATLLAFLAVAWAALVGWLEPILFGSNEFAPIDASQGVPRALLVGAWWILLALGLGLVARREAARALAADERGDGMEGNAADRRATLTRLAAGLVGVLAATLAATTSTEIGRALPPLVGDGAILVVSLVLLRLATHRASAYLYPAALGIVVALSDLNFTFIGQQSGVGIALLVEGAILLGAGLLADRLRRGLGGAGPMNTAIAVAPAE